MERYKREGGRERTLQEREREREREREPHNFKIYNAGSVIKLMLYHFYGASNTNENLFHVGNLVIWLWKRFEITVKRFCMNPGSG